MHNSESISTHKLYRDTPSRDTRDTIVSSPRFSPSKRTFCNHSTLIPGLQFRAVHIGKIGGESTRDVGPQSSLQFLFVAPSLRRGNAGNVTRRLVNRHIIGCRDDIPCRLDVHRLRLRPRVSARPICSNDIKNLRTPESTNSGSSSGLKIARSSAAKCGSTEGSSEPDGSETRLVTNM